MRWFRPTARLLGIGALLVVIVGGFSRGGAELVTWPRDLGSLSTVPAAPNGPDQQGRGVLFGDSFAEGDPQLTWQPYPLFNQDNLRGGLDPNSPAGEPGVGLLTNENVGGFAALSYVARETPADFRLESWVHFTVSEGEKGPLNGLAFRVDPTEGHFYRVASDFASDPRLTLAYIGRDNFPVYLATWSGRELPGGAPTESGWHRLEISVVAGTAEVYWDGVRLPGGPFAIDRIPSGFVGVYANVVGGLGHAETRVDDFQVRPSPHGPAR